MDKELKRIFKNSEKRAKVYVDKGPKIRIKSSLDYMIRTKEQADRFMKALKAAQSE